MMMFDAFYSRVGLNCLNVIYVDESFAYSVSAKGTILQRVEPLSSAYEKDHGSWQTQRLSLPLSYVLTVYEMTHHDT